MNLTIPVSLSSQVLSLRFMLDEARHKDTVKDSLGGGSHDVACGDDG